MPISESPTFDRREFHRRAAQTAKVILGAGLYNPLFNPSSDCANSEGGNSLKGVLTELQEYFLREYSGKPIMPIGKPHIVELTQKSHPLPQEAKPGVISSSVIQTHPEFDNIWRMMGRDRQSDRELTRELKQGLKGEGDERNLSQLLAIELWDPDASADAPYCLTIGNIHVKRSEGVLNVKLLKVDSSRVQGLSSDQQNPIFCEFPRSLWFVRIPDTNSVDTANTEILDTPSLSPVNPLSRIYRRDALICNLRNYFQKISSS